MVKIKAIAGGFFGFYLTYQCNAGRPSFSFFSQLLNAAVRLRNEYLYLYDVNVEIFRTANPDEKLGESISMTNQNIRDVVILGSGPSGCTAAIYTARALLRPLLIAGYNSGGQLMLTSDVENFPGYKSSVTGTGSV